MSDPRRALPSVDAAMADPAVASLVGEHPRRAVVDAVRQTLDARRSERRGPERLADEVARSLAPSLRRVINATGVLLNTNLGRAPLADAAMQAAAAAAGYASVEWDAAGGERRSRHEHLRDHLRRLCGAEDALALNTNAGGVLVSLCALAAGLDGRAATEAIVSRGQLVEIGGGFRVPDILAASGCRLVEVGTTNRTRLADYAAAVGPRTGAILRVHRSNFRMEGFVEDVPLRELADLAARSGVPLIDDLGSGLLAADPLLPDEPDVRSSVAAGAVACFSADKLLGGPQAGIVAGPATLVERVARHPLSRALRVDKLRLAALAATLELHRDPAAAREAVPTLRALHEALEVRRDRAAHLADSVGAPLIPTEGRVGGGAAPGLIIPSWGTALAGDEPDLLAARLRHGRVPVAARIQDGRVVLDVLALHESEIAETAGLVAAAR